MKRTTLVLRSLRYYTRTHLGVILGCAISAAVLVGALFVGDSVRGSLRETALERLGRAHLAIDTGRRYFRADLAGRLAAELEGELETGSAAALRVDGVALHSRADGTSEQVNRVEVLGIDDAFLDFGREPSAVPLESGKIALNRKLARALGVAAGDEVSLRVFQPGLLSRDAPLASRSERSTRRGLFTVVAVLSDAALGRFSLKSDQSSPYNAFVSLAELQEKVDLEGRANLLFLGAAPIEAAREALRRAWRLEDLELSVRAAGPDLLKLESSRLYLDPPVSEAALDLVPESAGSITYLADSISSRDGKSTPYSFVAAVSPHEDRRLSPVPPDLGDDEIVVNRWLADELALDAGDPLELIYSELTPAGNLVPRERVFRVREVVAMEALETERALAPEFPGLTDVERCEDWDIGITTDEEKLEDEANEAYWDEYRQTPKALVALSAGREMWGNRYGDLMTVRYLQDAISEADLRETLRDRLDPAVAGVVIRPVREEALRAVSESMDLGQLFLGMSLFLIAASLVLTAMLFVFSVEQRAREMGILLAVGYTPGQVRRLFLLEGLALAALGSLAGVPLGWGFAKVLIEGLRSGWSGAIADAAIGFHASAGSAVLGAVAGTGISAVAMTVAMWRQARRPVRQLVSEDFSQTLETGPLASGGRVRRSVFVLATAGAVGVAAWAALSGAGNPAAAFFGAGSLMLIGGIALVRMTLARLARDASTSLSMRVLGARNTSRRPGRSMATAGMLATGCFVVFSVSAMKEDFSDRAGERRSGTGGFELYGETSIALHDDLNEEEDRREHRLDGEESLAGVSFVPVRLRDGDDASCLNLNQSLTPPLLGIDAATFSELGAFTGKERADELFGLLEKEYPDGIVPAIVGDSATPVWKLKREVGPEDGAVLDYLDERGNRVGVKLVAALPFRLTVFQGRLLVAVRDFTRMFPSEGGYRVLLADVPPERVERVRELLTEKLDRVGLDLVTTVERLEQFYVVESTYLMMFVVLGGMGLLLGTAGMGILVLRNVLERRSELALLRAVGFSKNQAARVVLSEHGFLLLAGVVTGTAASALAVGPSVARPEIHVPYGLLAAFLVGTATLSLGWMWSATRLALRAPLVPALRNE